MADPIVQTLLAERGAKFDETGEAIASYGRSIVFLPKECEIGKNYRLVLREIREDSRGRMMYRAVPAEDLYSESWKDNGDGTASRVTIVTDWMLAKSEVGTVETRALDAGKEYPAGASTRTDRIVVWGNDLVSSVVLEEQVKVIPVRAEKVEGGKLVWVKTGEHCEPGQPVEFPVEKVEYPGINLDKRCMDAIIRPSWEFCVSVVFSVATTHEMRVEWQKMPSWLQTGIEEIYRPCLCGRMRVQYPLPDDYTRCNLCRKEEKCQRCGETPGDISAPKGLGMNLCGGCRPLVEAEQEIASELPIPMRERIAEEAKRLLIGAALPQAEGEAVLKATSDHIVSDWQRSQLLQKWSGYQWYYFTDEGVFGSKLASAALQILQYLPQATGDGLVELVVWIVGGAKGVSSDYYLRTQFNGEKGITPSITKDRLSQVVLADRLRGSEPDRQNAISELQNVGELASDEAGKLAEEARELMQAEAQDYALVLQKLSAAYAAEQRTKKATRQEVEPFDEDGLPQTAMATALRKAGLV